MWPRILIPTFVSGKLTIDNFRWAGVPFYIRTGKRMKSKSIQVVVEFKEVPMNLYYETDKLLDSNLLVINIQPNEGVSLHLNAKKNIQGIDTEPVQLSYAMSAQDKMNTVDAYENLLFDCLKGDATNFTHWEELKSTWKFVTLFKMSGLWLNHASLTMKRVLMALLKVIYY